MKAIPGTSGVAFFCYFYTLIPCHMKYLLSAILLCISFLSFTQNMYKPSDAEIKTLPAWAKLMYSDNPNVWKVDSLYNIWYANHDFEKSFHTQFYKRWRRSVENKLDANGYVTVISDPERRQHETDYLNKLKEASDTKSGNWQVVGPIQTRGNDGLPKGSQTNVYSFDQCTAWPDILYCGTEPGEVYKSIDHGQSWTCSSMDIDFGGGVSAVEVNVVFPDIVFAGSGSKLMKSIDGGLTWTLCIQQNGLNVNEILISTINDQIVFAATDKGLYRSIDGGTNFTQIFPQKCYDIKANTLDPNTLYILKNNPTLIRAEFFKSTDLGATWTLKDNGWYSSTDPARNDGGARLAVTMADPQRIYAYLIGEAKANDYGYIGVYRSDNGGESWYLPNGPAGGPYTGTHPNLAYGNPGWTYHQGFYNCAIMANQSDADVLLIGGLNLWRSNDGGTTFAVQGGYQGNALDIHVDQQDFRAFSNETWITNDGGVYYSDDFFDNSNLVKMAGIHGSDYWGFGSGWNEDVLVGGLYHNGNLAWYEQYADGDFLELGGGEAATGYVNPGDARKTCFSDIGGRYLPLQIGNPVLNFAFGMYPNETYWAAESSEMEYHPACYNIIVLGKENKLWKSVNGGTGFDLVHEFGTDVNSHVRYIEISRSNPDVMYLSQQPSSGNTGTLWKTMDGGLTWNTVAKPSGNSRKILLALSPDDENKLWMAYPQASNGNKIFKTQDGGITWTNITTAMLNGESPQSISLIGGTPGGIYFCTNKTIFYRNDTMTDWQLVNSGLPTYISTDIARPFYRDGKLRIASYGKGIWETPFVEQPVAPVAQIMVNQLEEIIHCTTDTFYFDDHSMLNHANASWQWTFQGGTPAVSSLRNPKVVFSSPGNHQVTLTVTNGNGVSDSDTLNISLASYTVPVVVNEGFEAVFPPTGWEIYNPDQDATWSVSNSAGGFGWSARSAIFDNFNNDAQGKWDDLRFSVNLTNSNQAKLVFDVAYARWGEGYSDTLEILVSTDCGLTFTQLYKKGGEILATAPDNQNYFYPNFSQWRTDTVDLAAFAGQPDVMIAYRNINDWGNVLYIDNPRTINGTVGVEDLIPDDSYAALYPNPVQAGRNVFLSTHEKGSVKTIFFDAAGKKVLQTSLRSGESFLLDKNLFKPAMYYFLLIGETTIQRGKLLISSLR